MCQNSKNQPYNKSQRSCLTSGKNVIKYHKKDAVAIRVVSKRTICCAKQKESGGEVEGETRIDFDYYFAR